MWGWSVFIRFRSQKYNILFLNRSDCTDFIVRLFLGNAYTLVTVWGDCPLPALQKALSSALPGWETFCFLSSFTQALPLFFNTTAHSPLAQRGNSFKREAPGQFPLPSFAACHVVYSAQLFKKCWISTMAFTGALSTFVWSNLGWMRWVPEQGELSCSVHYHTSDWPALSLFIFLCCTWNCHGGAPLWMAAVGVWARLGAAYVTAIFQSLVLCLGLLTASCWRSDWGSNSSIGSSQSLVSVLNFLARVGGGR